MEVDVTQLEPAVRLVGSEVDRPLPQIGGVVLRRDQDAAEGDVASQPGALVQLQAIERHVIDPEIEERPEPVEGLPRRLSRKTEDEIGRQARDGVLTRVV